MLELPAGKPTRQLRLERQGNISISKLQGTFVESVFANAETSSIQIQPKRCNKNLVASKYCETFQAITGFHSHSKRFF